MNLAAKGDSQTTSQSTESFIKAQWVTPDCSNSAIWLQSACDCLFHRELQAMKQAPESNPKLAQCRIIQGFDAESSNLRWVSEGDLQSGRFFLQSGPDRCNLQSGFFENISSINGLRQIADCRIQIAADFCNLRRAAPHKASSQIADCRKTYNYVSNRMTRYRGHSVTDLGARSSSAHPMRGDR